MQDQDRVFRTALKYLSHKDTVMASLAKRLGSFNYINSMTPYEALIQGIIYQQLSSKAASAIYRRFLNLFDGRVPSPKELLDTQDSKIRTVGIMQRKVEYMKEVAKVALQGRLHLARLNSLSDDQLLKELDDIKGVGEWTIHMLMIFVLGRKDVFPANDLGIRKAIAKLYSMQRTPSAAEALKFSERWKPYRTYASLLLWRNFDSTPWP